MKIDAAHLRVLFLAFLVFLLIYNVSFKFNESLTTGRVAIAILFVWAVAFRKFPVILARSHSWLLFLPFLFVVPQYILASGDFGQTSRFVHLALYSYVGAALVVIVARDIKVALISILIAISVQSVILLYSFFSLEYRLWFDSIAVVGSNFGPEYIYRAPGFSSGGGAGLSLIQSLGVLIGWLLLRENKYYIPVSGKRVYLVFIAMSLSAVSCAVVGRTGLVLSIVFFMLFIFSYGLRKRLVAFYSLAFIALILFVNMFLASMLSDDFSLEWFVSWVMGFFSPRDTTFAYLASMNIPSLTLETLFGTGRASMVDGVNPSGHDSGFIQAYYSMGLFVSVIFYSLYLYVLYRVLSYFPLVLRIILMLVFFGIEIKEPFIFKYSTMFVLMTLHFSHLLIMRSYKIDSNLEGA